MLVTYIISGISELLHRLNFIDYSKYLTTYKGNIKYALITAIISLIVFSILCLFIPSSQKPEEHFQLWDFGLLKVLRYVRIFFICLYIIKNIQTVNDFGQAHTLLINPGFIILMVISDITCIIVSVKEYSDTIKMTVIDALLLQSYDWGIASILWVLGSIIYHFTIYGTILIFCFIMVIYSIFTKIFK